MSVNPFKYSPLLELRRKTRLPRRPQPFQLVLLGQTMAVSKGSATRNPRQGLGMKIPAVPGWFYSSFWKRFGIIPSEWTQLEELRQTRQFCVFLSSEGSESWLFFSWEHRQCLQNHFLPIQVKINHSSLEQLVQTFPLFMDWSQQQQEDKIPSNCEAAFSLGWMRQIP